MTPCAINVSSGYDTIPDYACVWNGNRETIHIFRDKIGTPLDPPDYPLYSTREELGRIVPEVPRGVQIQIRTNNKLSLNLGPSTFDVADIRIYPTCQHSNPFRQV